MEAELSLAPPIPGWPPPDVRTERESRRGGLEVEGRPEEAGGRVEEGEKREVGSG